MVWGLDGWTPPARTLWPPGTFARAAVTLTPMERSGDTLVTRLTIPRGARLDFSVNLTRTRRGAAVDVWDGDRADAFHPRVGRDTVLVIAGTPTLPAHGGESSAVVLWWTLVLLVVAAVAGTVLTARALRRSGWTAAHPEAAAMLGVMLFAVVTRIVLYAVGYVWIVLRAHADAAYLGVDFHHARAFLEPFSRSDIVQYFRIASQGYDAGPFRATQQSNWAFYPLWPLVLRGCRAAFGTMLVPGMIVSVGMFTAGVGLLYRLVRRRFDADVSRDTAVLLTLFPGTYFVMRPGPEALFLLLTIAAFWFADARRWLLAGLVAALATVTRVQGVLLFLPLAWMYWTQWRETRRHDWRVLALGLIPAALGTFMLYLWRVAGTPLASVRIQAAWGNQPTFPFDWLIRFVREPHLLGYYGWDLAPLSALLTLLALAGFIVMLRRPGIPREYTIYVALSLYLMITRDNTNAASRFLMQLFPLFLVLAMLVRQRPLVRDGVLVTLTILQTWAFLSFMEARNWAGT